MTTTRTRLDVHPIDPARLEQIRRNGTDGHGNTFDAYPASGQGEPLRCCLRLAVKDEQIALISFAPFDHASPWTEVGPVYVHADTCPGPERDGLPDDLRTGPRLLRTYRADDTMNYDHNTLVGEGEDIEPVLERLLSLPHVATVHVRTVLPQCFLFAVTR